MISLSFSDIGEWEPEAIGDSGARVWCPDLQQEGQWHHLVLVLNRAVLKNSSFSLYVDGQHVRTQKVSRKLLCKHILGYICYSSESLLCCLVFVGTLHFPESWWGSSQPYCCLICVWFYWDTPCLASLFTACLETRTLPLSRGGAKPPSCSYALSAGSPIYGEFASSRTEWYFYRVHYSKGMFYCWNSAKKNSYLGSPTPTHQTM